MEIKELKLDLDLLYQYRLSPDYYTFLYLSFHKHPGDLKDFCNIESKDLFYLEKHMFIKIDPEDNVTLRQKSNALFQVPEYEKLWDEFKALYPRKSGARMLHQDSTKCKEKYLKLVKVPGTHDKIIQGLQNEQSARIQAAKKGQFFPEWRMMSTYLNNHSWEAYLEYQEDKVVEKFKVI